MEELLESQTKENVATGVGAITRGKRYRKGAEGAEPCRGFAGSARALCATKRSSSRELSRRKRINGCTGCRDAAEGGRLLGRPNQRKLTRERHQPPTGSQSRGSREQRKKSPLTPDSGCDQRFEEICCHQMSRRRVKMRLRGRFVAIRCLARGMVGGRREESRSCGCRGSIYRNRG